MDCLNVFGKYIYDKYGTSSYRSSTIKTSSITGKMYRVSFGIDSITIQLITNIEEEDYEYLDRLDIEKHHSNDILLIMSNEYIIIDKDGNAKRIL